MPWYDLEPCRAANDGLWQGIGAALRAAGIDAIPDALDRHTAASAQWRDPRLLLSQACGLDLLWEKQIEPILAPSFELADCTPAHYYSHLIARPGVDVERDDLVAAVNSLRSHSGWTALLECITPKSIRVTGSHGASLEAVADGRCDVACIDAVTWSLLDGPKALIVGRSADALAPPFVTSQRALGTMQTERLVGAIRVALADHRLHPFARALRLRGVRDVVREDYEPVFERYHATEAVRSGLEASLGSGR